MKIEYFSRVLMLVCYYSFQVLGGNYSLAIVNETRYVLRSSRILLRCDTSSRNGSSIWKHRKHIIFLDRNFVSTQFPSHTVALVQNYSLLIKSTLLFHEGLYECVQNSVTVRRYKVVVEAPPNILITINETNTSHFVVLDQRKSLVSYCYVQNSKPVAKLRWEINGRVINPSEYSHECIVSGQFTYGSTYNCTSKLEERLQNESGVLTCIASAQNALWERNASVQFHTYLKPYISITTSGMSSAADTLFYRGDFVTAKCFAEEGRPKVNFTWKVNGEMEKPSRLECRIAEKSKYNNAYNCLSTLKINMTEDKGTITCMASADGYFARQILKITYSTVSSTAKLSTYTWTIAFMVLIPTMLLLALRYHNVRKRQKRIKKHDEARAHRLRLNLREWTTTVPMQVIPAEIKCRSCPILNDDDQGIYASSTERTSTVKVDNITITDYIPGHGVFGCWFATNTLDSSVIVAKSLKENAKLSDINIFEDVALALSSLPRHRNIANILGISIAGASSQIFQEFIDCGTLRDFLIGNYQSSHHSVLHYPAKERRLPNGCVDILDLFRFAFDIVNGMAFLSSNEFCHPALSAKQVLLNSVRACKLINFWPEKSSQIRLRNIFQKKDPPFSWLAPETIFLRQYSSESDVWSFAVVLWEIYSLGDMPYRGLTHDEIEIEIRNSKFLNKPRDCPGAVFNLMLSSWNLSSKDRPTFQMLRNQLALLDCNDRYDQPFKRKAEQPHYFTLSQGF